MRPIAAWSRVAVCKPVVSTGSASKAIVMRSSSVGSPRTIAAGEPEARGWFFTPKYRWIVEAVVVRVLKQACTRARQCQQRPSAESIPGQHCASMLHAPGDARSHSGGRDDGQSVGVVVLSAERIVEVVNDGLRGVALPNSGTACVARGPSRDTGVVAAWGGGGAAHLSEKGYGPSGRPSQRLRPAAGSARAAGRRARTWRRASCA